MPFLKRERPDLSGLRVLVVEDMLLVAEDISQELGSCGCDVVGPAGGLEEGLGLARDEPLDGAVLDVNLGGEYCFPIAAMLRSREVPFVFLTGYSEAGAFPPEFHGTPRITKPFDSAELVAIVGRQFRKPA